MLVLELFVHSVDLADGVLELESQTDLLVEGLVGLLEVLHEYFPLVAQIDVLVLESFELLVHGHVLVLVEFLVLLYNLLPLLYLNFEFLNLPQLVPLYFPNEGLIVASRTVFEQEGVDFPDVLDQLPVPLADFLNEAVEANAVHEQGVVYSAHITRLHSVRQQRVRVDVVLL